MKHLLPALLAALLPALPGCGGGDGVSSGPDTTQVVAMPASPLEVALEFSNLLALNDPECLDLIVPRTRDSLAALDVQPWDIFGRWRGFDPSGRLTEVLTDSTGSRTSYYCSIRRMDDPAIVRIDFLLCADGWLIEAFGEEIPDEVMDSLNVERIARMITANPQMRFEMRFARQLLDDCRIDSVQACASLDAALASGVAFEDYVASLEPQDYARLAFSNIRRSAKLQIVQDRATYNLTNVPVELNGFVASWRELAYLSKAVLRNRHEAMQVLRSTGEWAPVPDSTLDLARLAVLRSSFLAVSDLVEELDSLGTTWPALLTTGVDEPLEEMVISLDPHLTEQRFENDIGITVWRALGVEMNGDQDPERVVYWAGNLFLYEGRPSGYRLVWRTYEGYESDLHCEFSSQPVAGSSSREVTLVGSEGIYEYTLRYEGGVPVFGRSGLGSAE